MITKITLWKTDDGHEFDNEIDALRHENEQLRKELDQLRWQKSCQASTWGSQKYDGIQFYGHGPNSQLYPSTGMITTGIAYPSGISGQYTLPFEYKDSYFDPNSFGGSDYLTN